jgi:hypothetical protein
MIEWTPRVGERGATLWRRSRLLLGLPGISVPLWALLLGYGETFGRPVLVGIAIGMAVLATLSIVTGLFVLNRSQAAMTHHVGINVRLYGGFSMRRPESFDMWNELVNSGGR